MVTCLKINHMRCNMKNMRKVALFGNVNSDEVLAQRLRSEGVVVHGYLNSPNAAFSRACDRSVLLSKEQPGYLTEVLPRVLKEENYDVVHLGPDVMVMLLSAVLRQHGVPHVGATPEQLFYETDKSLVQEVFSEASGVLPKRAVVTDADPAMLKRLLSDFPDGYVLKFVGNYPSKYGGSPCGRVRFSGEMGSFDEALDFVRNSLDVSGKCVVETDRGSGARLYGAARFACMAT